MKEIHIEKHQFHIFNNRQIDIKDVDIENLLVSDKYSFEKSYLKYFIGYVNNFHGDLKPLFIKLPKFNWSVKSFEKVKYMLFILEEKHEDIFKEYNEIWNRVKHHTGKNFDVEVTHDDKFIKNKTKFYKN